jgi:hypothetical protein
LQSLGFFFVQKSLGWILVPDVPDSGAGFWFRMFQMFQIPGLDSRYWFWIPVLHFEGQIKNNPVFIWIIQIV